MATTITRKSVLTAIKDGKAYTDLTGAERIIFDKMLAQVSKKSTPTVTRARRENIADAKRIAGMLTDGTAFDGTFIRAKIPTVLTASKATAILNAGIAEGLFIKHRLDAKVGEHGKGSVLYMLASTPTPVWGDENESDEIAA